MFKHTQTIHRLLHIFVAPVITKMVWEIRIVKATGVEQQIQHLNINLKEQKSEKGFSTWSLRTASSGLLWAE